MKYERGFVLVTSLIMLSLLTLFSVAMYFVGRSATQTSGSAQSSTMAFYYAETANNYMAWAMRNDAEFDGFDFRGPPVNDSSAVNPSVFPVLTIPANFADVGDWTELRANMWNPGPTTISDTSAAGTAGQLMYFDNSVLGGRAVSWPAAQITLPKLYHISASLPRYIRLDIDNTGNITPSMPALPHPATPVVGVDIPNNGAIVWLTGGDTTKDIEYGAASACAADPSPPANPAACDVNAVNYIEAPSIVVYTIGYVNGQARKILRTVLGE
jgi:hypothetical protein